MIHSPRKTAPAVRAGRVQKKNNWDETPDYYIAEQPELVIDRKRPGEGFRHLLSQADIRRFISIVPDWEKHSQGLNAVVLAPGKEDHFGHYNSGVISLCAWPLDGSISVNEYFLSLNTEIMQCLAISCSPDGNGYWTLDCDQDQVRAFQLLSTFLHELGHHNDYLNTRAKENANRGESHAEEFALELGLKLWPTYQKAFRI